MKKLAFLIPALFLMLSVCAFAQNEVTLKGDVNGDGIIDVEDVTSVVDIILSGKTYGYFYFGTTEPTADSFMSLPGVMSSYISIDEAVGATVPIAEGETLYMLCPAAWMKGKHVEVEDGDGNSYDFLEDNDAGTISGYVIYRTQAFNEATDAMLKFNNSSAETYYWYVGTTSPNDSNIETIANETLTEKPTTWASENPKSIAATNNTGESCPIYYCFPTDWNVVVLDVDKVTVMLLPDVTTFIYNNIEYTVKKTGRNIPNGATKNYYAKC